MAPLEYGSMLTDQCERPLLQPKRGAFFYAYFGALGMAAIGREDRDIGIDPKRVIPPVPGSHHAPIKIEDSHELGTLEAGDWAPIPDWRERRNDAQALFAFGCV